MRYSDVIARLVSVDFSNLPGNLAHQQLAPAHRKPAADYLKETTDYKVAAVLAMIVPDQYEEACLVLIQRSGGQDVHAGQISFPGGKCEPGETLMETAVRETLEEVGISGDKIKIHGALTTLYIPPSRFLVHPYLASLEVMPDYLINTEEVARVLEIPLRYFLQNDSIQTSQFGSARGYQISAPYYEWESLKIWGATAMMISEITALLK